MIIVSMFQLNATYATCIDGMSFIGSISPIDIQQLCIYVSRSRLGSIASSHIAKPKRSTSIAIAQ